jgi:TolB-like protein
VTAAPDAANDRLESWKAIAAYLKRGVRTVRRWEREEGLPVHRHVHRVLGSVYASKLEIDAWQRQDRRAAVRESDKPDVMSEDSPSIAVLPFANLSANSENEYFADGLTEEIAAVLSRLHSLRVTSRTSSARFKGSAKDAKEISRELGVRYLLEGSVRRAGDRLRVTAQLIDARADNHLWAESYDGNVEDVFGIQERIARVIVRALELRLTREEDQRLAERTIDDFHAYECYLRARQQGWRWRKDAIDQAVQLLRNGLALLGDNARLYAALGVAYLQYREAGIDFGAWPVVEAEACVRKTFELGPESAAGFQLRGWIQYARGQIQGAVRDLKLAFALEPNDADTLLLLSNCYLISGRVSAGRPLIRRLTAIDPLTPVTRCMPAFADLVEGQFAAAIEPYRQMFEMDPGNPMGRLFYLWVLLINGRDDLIPAIVDDFPVEVRETVPAHLAFFIRDVLRAKRHAKPPPEITSGIEAAATGTDVFARILADAYALAGRTAPAMHWLEVAVDRGFINYEFLSRFDPLLESLRGEAGFQRLMAVVRDRWERFEA